MRRVSLSGDLQRFSGTSAGTGTLLAATGLAVWIALSIWGGIASPEPAFRLHEAWHVPAYFFIGIPLMVAAVTIAAFLRPARAWR